MFIKVVGAGLFGVLNEFGDDNHVAGRRAMCVHHPDCSAQALLLMITLFAPR